MKLATLNLEVTGLRRSADFYTRLFDLREDPQRSHPPGFVYLRGEGLDLTLAERPQPQLELGFETADLDAFRKRAQGVELNEQKMGWGEAIELRDPDGNRVIVYRLR